MSKKNWIILGIVCLILLIVTGNLTGRYNQFITLSEQTDSSWAQVETVLQRRYDLIPNLVNTVQGFADQEREVLTEVTRLRSQWGEAQSQGQRAAASGLLEGALGRLMVVVERYPDLKSNQNFLAKCNMCEFLFESMKTWNSTNRSIQPL